MLMNANKCRMRRQTRLIRPTDNYPNKFLTVWLEIRA